MVLLVAFSSPTAGQTSSSETSPRIQILESEIEEARDQLQQVRTSFEAQIQVLEGRRRALAEELLTLQLQRDGVAGRIASLTQSSLTLLTDNQNARETIETLSRATVELADELCLHLAEAPGTDSAQAALRNAIGDLTRDPPTVESKKIADCFELVSRELGRTHDKGTGLVLETITFRTQDGLLEEVELLSIGHVGFCYRAGEDRFAIALQSPTDATGFRWSESLEKTTFEMLAAAWDALESPSLPVSITVPLDPTRRLRVESLTQPGDLVSRLKSGGPIMGPLLLVAVCAMVLILERSWVLLREGRSFESRLQQVLAFCREHRFDEAESACEKANGAVPRTLRACLGRRALGLHAMEDGIQEQLLYEIPRLQRFLGGIAVLGAVAPLLGLLGTVTGIIRTFSALREFGGSNPGVMAGGIAEALMTTAAGLVIAIAVFLIHGLLSGRVDRILADAEKGAATLINLLGDDR